MFGRAIALSALLSLSALAGCLDDPSEAPGAAVDEVEPTDLSALAPPDNRTGDFNAFDETNATESGVGGVDHHHDYWLGRGRVEIFRDRAHMDVRPVVTPTVKSPAPQPRYASVVFNMPVGALVFEGTAQFEFLVDKPERHVCEPTGVTWNAMNTCTDGSGFGTPEAPRVPDPSPPQLKLEYQHASTGRDEWIDGGMLTWGAPVVIPVQPDQTDMPHSTTSLWRYRVTSTQAIVDSTLTFEASASIVKGEDVPLWPGHPDFYAERSSRIAYDGPSSTTEGGFGEEAFGYETSLVQTTPGRLISYGTKSLYVWINITKVDAPPAFAPTHWYLYFHNATGDWQAAGLFDPNVTADKRELLFVLPVSDDGMDSPYAPDSRWEFVLRGTLEADYVVNKVTCYGGCANYAVDYNMFIVATNREAPEGTYSPIDDVT